MFRIGLMAYAYVLCAICAIIIAQNSWTLDPSVDRALPVAILAAVSAVIGTIGMVFFYTRSLVAAWLSLLAGAFGLGIALGAFYAILFR